MFERIVSQEAELSEQALSRLARELIRYHNWLDALMCPGGDPHTGEVHVDPDASQDRRAALANLAAWEAYLATGKAQIPTKDPDLEFEPTTALDQYIKAYGITPEELKDWYESRNP